MFGRTKEEKTFLILDVENGSVGSALVHLRQGAAPKLFGETRIRLPVLHTRDSGGLLENIKNTARSALRGASELAARLRAHPKTSNLGHVSDGAIFLAAPWGSPDLAMGQPRFVQSLTSSLNQSTAEFFGTLPTALHTGAGAALHGTKTLLPYEQSYLLSIVTSELTELLLVQGGAAAGYATLPFGTCTLVRTLRSHAGVSEHEARSMIKLGVSEPLAAAQSHFANEFAATAGDLFAAAGPTEQVYIVSTDDASEFARALHRSEAASALFPRGSTVRRINVAHIVPYLAAHAPTPDLGLMLAALYTNGICETSTR